MRKGKAKVLCATFGLAIVGVLSLVASGCGGGGGGGGHPSEDTQDLWVERFSVPNFSGILLDEAVSLVFSEFIKQGSLNHDSIRMRTGAGGGEAPRGTFVKGIFLIDRDTGTRVVIDPDQIGPRLLKKIEAKGKVDLVPRSIRYDLGAVSALNGSRLVLQDHHYGGLVTFIPEIPTRPDLSDTGYVPGSTYTVVVPAFPALNTVISRGNDPVLPREGRVFVSSFTTVPITSPQLFLGGENEGRPRVVNTVPANGSVEVGADQRIFLRFSQALDPRTISTDNFFLEISSVSGRPQIPVSLFLRQTRLGLVEVVMTPLQDLPGDAFFEVTVTSGVRDLLGSFMNPHVISFSTAEGTGTPDTIVETFTSNSKEDAGVNTANWNNSKPFVGGTPDALTAVFAPFAGSGTDGDFDPTVGEVTYLDTGTLTQNIFNYTSMNIRIGSLVLGEGNFGLVMRCQGDVRIDGTIEVSGLDGGVGNTGSSGDDDAKGGAGGIGGPGGHAGGDGAFATIGAGGNFDGVNGFGTGGGKGGFSGDNESSSDPFDAGRAREGGGGGGHASAGNSADVSNYKNTGGGLGGGTYGAADFSDATLVPPIVGVSTLVSGFGGSGGGGGGGEDDVDGNGANGTAGGEDEGGGGGGGGGGALQIVSYGDLVVRGRLAAYGANGGNSFNAATGDIGQGAAGGGGAGGSIWLQAFGDIVLDALAQIEATGGLGGTGDWNGIEKKKGGNGGDGFIRLEDADGTILVPSTVTPQNPDTVGAFNPTQSLDSFARSLWYNQFIPTPNYGTPSVDQDLNGGSITIEVQGAREDVTLPGLQPVDPDTDPTRAFTTDWTPLSLVDNLDNFQYLRFRVFFSVDPLHSFTDPLPIVREIVIPVTTVPDSD